MCTLFPSTRHKMQRNKHPRIANTTFILDDAYTLATLGTDEDNRQQLYYNDSLIAFLKKYNISSIYLLANMCTPKTSDHLNRVELVQHLLTHGIRVEAIFTGYDNRIFSLKEENATENTLLDSYQLGDHYKNIVAPAEEALLKLKEICQQEKINPDTLFEDYIHNKIIDFWTSLKNKDDKENILHEIKQRMSENKILPNVAVRLQHFICNSPENAHSTINLDAQITPVFISHHHLSLLEDIFNSVLAEQKIAHLCQHLRELRAHHNKAKLIPHILRKYHQIRKIVLIDDTPKELNAMDAMLAKWKIPGIAMSPPLPTTELIQQNFNNAEHCISPQSFEKQVLQINGLTYAQSTELQATFRALRKTANTFNLSAKHKTSAIKKVITDLSEMKSVLLANNSPEITDFRSFKIDLLNVIIKSPSYKPRQLTEVLSITGRTIQDSTLKILDDLIELLNKDKHTRAHQAAQLQAIQQFALAIREYLSTHPSSFADPVFWEKITLSTKFADSVEKRITHLLLTRNQLTQQQINTASFRDATLNIQIASTISLSFP